MIIYIFSLPPGVKETEKMHSTSNQDGRKKQKRPWESWSLEDKNTFFEALNEYGKDFDAIQNHLAAKVKKRGLAKNKEQVRHFYYRTWHKISKYLHPSTGTSNIYTSSLWRMIMNLFL